LFRFKNVSEFIMRIYKVFGVCLTLVAATPVLAADDGGASSVYALAPIQQKASSISESVPDKPVSAPRPASRSSYRQKALTADAEKAAAMRPLIAKYAAAHGVPVGLADAVVRVESRYNPQARNGVNIGLTQINPLTARSLGFSGSHAELMNPETNLNYGIKYLGGAYKLAGGDTCGTILRYQAGHRATRMTGAAQSYCSKVKLIMASR
jgi:soluble lytic murein transglycosylase-like protein